MPDDKTMSITNTAQAKEAGVTVFGDPDVWQCVCKAFNEAEGWMKSTKVMDVKGGVVLQVTTQQRNQSGSYSIAEAVTFVPGVKAADLVPKPEEDVPDVEDKKEEEEPIDESSDPSIETEKKSRKKS